MDDIAPEVVSIADACLGGLQGRSALLIGPKEQSSLYDQLLRRAHMENIFQEETSTEVSALLPHVQLVISMPTSFHSSGTHGGGNLSVAVSVPTLTAAIIAKGCERRRTPLLIFDLDPSSSVEELAGLLPSVCLYTPEDLRSMLPEPKAVKMMAS
jgi:hypothetical protein